MLTKYKTIANTITNTLVIPSSLSFEFKESLTGEEYSSFAAEFLYTKFTIFLSNTAHQAIVQSKDTIETLAIVHQQWDSVVIGQSLSNAIQKWIDTNLELNIVEVGAYGFKLKSFYRIGVFIFVTIEYYNKDNTINSERKQLFSIHSDVGKKCLLIIDLIGVNHGVDLTLIPTNNRHNPILTAIMNDYEGAIAELDFVIKYLMKNNFKNSFDKN